MARRWVVTTFSTKMLDEIFRSIEREEYDIEAYCPMMKTTRSVKGIVTITEKPMYLNYMFLKYDVDIPLLYSSNIIRKVPIRFIRRHGDICLIHSREIAKVRAKERFLNNDYEKLHTDRKFLEKYIGRKVVVRDGNFNGMIGLIKDVTKSGFFKIQILIFNRLVDYDISVDYVEITNG